MRSTTVATMKMWSGASCLSGLSGSSETVNALIEEAIGSFSDGLSRRACCLRISGSLEDAVEENWEPGQIRQMGWREGHGRRSR